MPNRRPLSLQLRLQLWLGAFLALLIGGFAFSVYRLEAITFYHQVDHLLDGRVSLVARDFRACELALLHAGGSDEITIPLSLPSPAGDDRRESFPPPPPHERIPVTLSADVLKTFADDTRDCFAVWTSDGILLSRSPGLPPPCDFPPPPEENSLPAAPRDTRFQHLTRGEWRISFCYNEIGDCILAGVHIGKPQARLARLAAMVIVGALAATLLGLGGIALILRPALRPLRDISDTTRRVSAGDLSARIPPSPRAPRELLDLSADLNRAYAALEAGFARERRFTSDVAHELRNPIAVILSETQLALRRDHEPAEYRETLQTCESTAQEMRSLVESLLQLARLENGSTPTGRIPLDLAALARKAADTLRPAAEARNTALSGPDAPCPVSGNPDQLLRLVLNLVSNAIDYSPAGATVRIDCSRTPAAAVLSVSDNGPGIDPADLPHLFDRFYRASRSRTRDSGHAGIGLALCKAIAEAHGGTLSVSSTPGQGATFTATFPLS